MTGVQTCALPISEEAAEPVKRESKASGEKAADVSDLVKKWSKK